MKFSTEVVRVPTCAFYMKYCKSVVNMAVLRNSEAVTDKFNLQSVQQVITSSQKIKHETHNNNNNNNNNNNRN
jgi:hypothetical protein